FKTMYSPKHIDQNLVPLNLFAFIVHLPPISFGQDTNESIANLKGPDVFIELYTFSDQFIIRDSFTKKTFKGFQFSLVKNHPILKSLIEYNCLMFKNTDMFPFSFQFPVPPSDS